MEGQIIDYALFKPRGKQNTDFRQIMIKYALFQILTKIPQNLDPCTNNKKYQGIMMTLMNQKIVNTLLEIPNFMTNQVVLYKTFSLHKNLSKPLKLLKSGMHHTRNQMKIYRMMEVTATSIRRRQGV